MSGHTLTPWRVAKGIASEGIWIEASNPNGEDDEVCFVSTATITRVEAEANATLHIGDATTEAAHITNSEGWDVANLNRLVESQSALHAEQLLSGEEWQALVDKLHAGLTYHDRLVAALSGANLSLKELAAHDSGVFADDAPEFNEGGHGYEAIKQAQELLAEIEKEAK